MVGTKTCVPTWIRRSGELALVKAIKARGLISWKGNTAIGSCFLAGPFATAKGGKCASFGGRWRAHSLGYSRPALFHLFGLLSDFEQNLRIGPRILRRNEQVQDRAGRGEHTAFV